MESLITSISLENSNVIDLSTQENINLYYHNKNQIDFRLQQLEKETDIEKIFRLRDVIFIFGGIALCFFYSNMWWLLLPLYSALSIFIHVFRGSRYGTWLLQRMGFRTRKEIDKEKYALKALRGDFHLMLDVPNAVWEAVNK